MRGKRAKKRELFPDAKYGSLVISKFINNIMLDGKKSIAASAVYKALDNLQVTSKLDENKSKKYTGLEVFERALDNIKPKLEIRSRRIGGANYQIPMPVSPERQTALAMRWIIQAARDSRKTTDFAGALQHELELAFNGEGVAVKKKEDTMKMAEANKAFAQFAS